MRARWMVASVFSAAALSVMTLLSATSSPVEVSSGQALVATPDWFAVAQTNVASVRKLLAKVSLLKLEMSDYEALLGSYISQSAKPTLICDGWPFSRLSHGGSAATMGDGTVSEQPIGCFGPIGFQAAHGVVLELLNTAVDFESEGRVIFARVRTTSGKGVISEFVDMLSFDADHRIISIQAAGVGPNPAVSRDGQLSLRKHSDSEAAGQAASCKGTPGAQPGPTPTTAFAGGIVLCVFFCRGGGASIAAEVRDA